MYCCHQNTCALTCLTQCYKAQLTSQFSLECIYQAYKHVFITGKTKIIEFLIYLRTGGFPQTLTLNYSLSCEQLQTCNAWVEHLCGLLGCL